MRCKCQLHFSFAANASNFLYSKHRKKATARHLKTMAYLRCADCMGGCRVESISDHVIIEGRKYLKS